MDLTERKAQFISLLQELLQENEGIQARLADKLEINSKRLSSWFQRQIDPANLETGTFERVAKAKGFSAEELAKSLGFIEPQKTVRDKFKNLIKERLSNQTQEQLAATLGVKPNTISNWLSLENQVDPFKIGAGTMFALAKEKGWNFDDLLSYFHSEPKIFNKKLLMSYKSELSLLSLKEQTELLFWLLIEIIHANQETQKPLTNIQSKKKIIFLLSEENFIIATKYASNLVIHANCDLDNLTVCTYLSLPKSLEDFELLILNIEGNISITVELINKISFNGDIVIFTSQDLEPEVRSQLEDKVTDIVVKPIDWSSLKDKPYFS